MPDYVRDDECVCRVDRGHTHPRIFTQPLRELTPDTTEGFRLIKFAEALGLRLLPWQKWLALHALELLPDGTPRFKTIVLLIARQNGKTTFAELLMLFWLVIQKRRLVVTTAQNLGLSEKTWEGVVESLEAHPLLAGQLRGEPSRAFGKKLAKLIGGREFLPKVRSSGAARGLTIWNLFMDELREDVTFEGYSALVKAMNAVPDGQVFIASNAGDLTSIVLSHLRDIALADIREGTESGIGLFEFSADEELDAGDFQAWRQANPSLGYTITRRVIEDGYAQDPIAVHRTEVLCQWVSRMDAPIDLGIWNTLGDPKGSLAEAFKGSRLRLAVDVSPDLQHITLVAAAWDQGVRDRVRIQIVKEWGGKQAVKYARNDLQKLVTALRPLSMTWFPSGPGAALKATMHDLKGTEKVEVTGTDVAGVCVALSEQVTARAIIHSAEGLFVSQLIGAKRIPAGDGWRFERRIKDGGHVDSLYAAAAAVHSVRLNPIPSFEFVSTATEE